MTKSNKVQGSIFWVRDRKTKITVVRKDGEMKVRKGASVVSVDLNITEDKFTNGMNKAIATSKAASLCSVCNSSKSIHQNEQFCKGEK